MNRFVSVYDFADQKSENANAGDEKREKKLWEVGIERQKKGEEIARMSKKSFMMDRNRSMTNNSVLEPSLPLDRPGTFEEVCPAVARVA